MYVMFEFAEKGELADKLQQVTLSTLNPKECLKRLAKVHYAVAANASATVMCTYSADGSDACQGAHSCVCVRSIKYL
jgi:hypothetical protein